MIDVTAYECNDIKHLIWSFIRVLISINLLKWKKPQWNVTTNNTNNAYKLITIDNYTNTCYYESWNLIDHLKLDLQHNISIQFNVSQRSHEAVRKQSMNTDRMVMSFVFIFAFCRLKVKPQKGKT